MAERNYLALKTFQNEDFNAQTKINDIASLKRQSNIV